MNLPVGIPVERIMPGWRVPNQRDFASHATVAPTRRVTVGANAKFATKEDIKLNTAEKGEIRQTTYNLREQIKLLQKERKREIGERAKEQL